MVFIVGTSTNFTENLALAKESEFYKDIISTDFHDTYENLVLKGMSALHWIAKYCPIADFAMKTDDDVIIDPFKLKSFIVGIHKTKSSFYGFVWRNAKVDRVITSKNYVSRKDMLADFYPDYCSGGGYIFPTFVAEKLLHASSQRSSTLIN